MLFIEQTSGRELIAVEDGRFVGRKQPMNFNEFARVFQSEFAQMIASGRQLYTVDTDRQSLWDTYLESFPASERQSHNCNACRSFIKNYGHLVTIDDQYNIKSIWDFTVDDLMWQSVVNNLRDLVYCCNIRDVFVPESYKLGFKSNIQRIFDPETQKLVDTIEWEHLYLEVPRSYVTGRVAQDYRDPRNVFKRALEEFDVQTVQIVLDLIDQGLYKGVEYKIALETFLQEQQTFISTVLTSTQVENYYWVAASRVGIGVAKIRNSAIGTLLIDISKDVDLDTAIRKYEHVVAPENYKRTQATFVSQRQTDDAEATAIKEGLMDSLARRYAVQEDISANDVLWLNRSLASNVKSVFGLLKQDTPTDPKKLSRIDEVSIEDFLNNILPKSTSVDILLENKHTNNLFSLIAPTNPEAKPLTRWNNNFSWYYTGDVTDSIIKRNVEKAGGCINAVKRFSIQWNEKGDNNIDFDAHAEIQTGRHEHIYYAQYRGSDLRSAAPSSGLLDVDIVQPNGKVAVENIVYHNLEKMPEGIYHLFVENFSDRISNGGFAAELEYGGVLYSYQYNSDLKPKQRITVAKYTFTKQNGIQFIESLESNSTVQSKEVWGLTTNTWQPVSVALLSPNYWHNGDQKGNKHFFFVLEKALNNDPVVRGFYNEFLVESLYPHRKVFEILGRRLLVEPSDQQLSGLGFSSTLRQDFLVRVTGASQRVLRVKV